MKRLLLLGACAAALACTCNAMYAGTIEPGKVWLDTAGKPVQAHGGGILQRGQTFYWYGEDRTPGMRGAVACYSSTNLVDWKKEGVALSRDALPQVDGQPTFVERPKVLFNQRTGKYVMWMHLEQRGYHFARAGIAQAEAPAGPFTFLNAIRPITNDFQFPADANRQKEFGGTYRDMTLFQDDDGRAYAYYASENNATLYVVRLNAQFTGPELPAIENQTWARVLVGRMREAPAPFKYQGRYYLITSGCTGWDSNPADYAVAERVLGPYVSKGNPCVGPDADKTFHSQSTFVLPFPGKPGTFIFMADRWNRHDLPDSRYIWLPFTMDQNGAFELKWADRWELP
ncbi:MAG TPA: glycoside hydrolase family 43 protein [Clostridia bacterium]|nr:glycoside hydrolase family 43 protein [Clostridia bacterium]